MNTPWLSCVSDGHTDKGHWNMFNTKQSKAWLALYNVTAQEAVTCQTEGVWHQYICFKHRARVVTKFAQHTNQSLSIYLFLYIHECLIDFVQQWTEEYYSSESYEQSVVPCWGWSKGPPHCCRISPHPVSVAGLHWLSGYPGFPFCNMWNLWKATTHSKDFKKKQNKFLFLSQTNRTRTFPSVFHTER